MSARCLLVIIKFLQMNSIDKLFIGSTVIMCVLASGEVFSLATRNPAGHFIFILYQISVGFAMIFGLLKLMNIIKNTYEQKIE